MSSTHGLGVMLMQGRDFGDISQVVAMMIVIIVIGLAVDRLLFGRLERKVWRRWGLNQH
jgi:NitT/TauT family transport system permease protein